MRTPLAAATLALLLAACGGGSNPLGNPPDVANPQGTFGRRLSFAYFQACVQPVLTAALPVAGGSASCAAGGCHDSATGTGGALRLVAAAAPVDAAAPAEAVRTTEMYRNFYSAQGLVVIGSPDTSLLLAKPRLAGVLHGGGLVFEHADDAASRRIAFWIARPMPAGEDEFSAASAAMFGADGGCLTQ